MSRCQWVGQPLQPDAGGAIGGAVRVGSAKVAKIVDKSTAVLNAAEQLFGESGYDAVSMRHIAMRAKVGLGMVTYYFTTKDVLFRSVLERRADALNSKRIEALEAMKKPTAEAVVRAFTEPLFELIRNGEPGWRAYSAVLAHAHQSSVQSAILAEYFNETSDRFVSALAKVAPGLSYDARIRAFNMTGIIMFGLLSHRRLDSMSHGQVRSEDLTGAHEYMVSFAVGGLTALTAQRSAAARQHSAARRRPGASRKARQL